MYLCQRYGSEIVGGAESACRFYAEHLVARGHSVQVLTSTAREYTTWANHYAPGDATLNGVAIHRLPVRSERAPEVFGPMQARINHGPRPMPLAEQRRWADLVGPDVGGLEAWLGAHAAEFDVVIFMTYLYTTTTRGLPAVAGRLPTILQPTAHDEPSIWAPLFDTILRLPDSYLFLTAAEQRFMQRRLHRYGDIGAVVGIGIDDHPVADPTPFRTAHGLVDSRYLLYVGRVDSGKGTGEAVRFFAAYKNRHPGDLKLVLAGEVIDDAPEHPDVVFTGFLSEEMKRSAMAGSVALLQPSYFESFSIVLCESWMQARPALVQGRCEVLVEQVRRAQGGLPYSGFATFEAAVDLLLEDQSLADRLGAAGRSFVIETYNWTRVLDEFERALDDVRSRFVQRRYLPRRGL